MELLLSASCSPSDLPFGLADQITLTLGGSGNIVAHNGASNIIVGTWELNACACATELTFFDLDCGSIDLGVGEGGLIAQVSAADDCCLSVTDPADTWCSTEFLASLTDQTVQCPEDLPTDCDPIIQGEDVCSDNLFLCSFSQAEEGYLTHLVTTAEGPGADAVIRIYGLSAQSVCLSDYFVEDPLAPLELIRYPETGTARLVGSVHNDLDPSMTFDVDMYFNAEQPAEEWLAEGAGHSLLTSWACDVDPANITLYNMTNTISRMTGTGSLQGEIYLNHMPISYNKRFQLGEGANNHNCEYGFGGWFGWHGIVDGMSVMGFSGDVIADLSAPTSTETFCGGEFAQITYASIDLGTGQSTYTTQTWTVEDTQAPEFVDANELAPSYTIEWSALHDEACGWNIEVPCLTTTDNCGDWNPQYEGCNEPENACGEVIFSEQIIEGDCAGEFTVIRLWQAIDGSGNMSTHQQVIMVEDTEGPDFTGTPYESTNACDDITVMDYVANDCSGVTSVWFEQTLQSGTCSNPGSISRTYHAVDGCGNESTFIQILNVTDEDAPVILTPDATVDCHAYSADEPYGHDVEDCDLRVWTEEDGQWTSTFNDNWSNEGDGLDTPVIVSWTDSAPVYNGNGESCYIVTRTLTASDNCGNTSTATQTIFLSDTTAPVLAASAVINIEHDIYEGNGSMLVTPAMAGLLLGGDQAQFQVTDNCSSDFGNDILVTWTDEATAEETCLQLEGGAVFIRTYSALDACGNTSTLTQEVVLVDTTAPTWSNSGETTDAVDCEEATLELMSNPNYMPLTGGVFDSGDADLDIELTATLMSGGCIGVWLRSWSATDDCGNTSYADQYVPMFDSMDPEFTSVPADMTIPLTEACSFNLAVEATGGVPTVYDNCELCLDQDLDVTYTNSEPTYLCGGEGGSFVIERTWSVTDHCGNTTTHVQTLTFTDVTAPVFNETLPGDLAVDCEAPDADVLTATDACAGDVEVIFEEEVTAQTCPNTYTLVRTWTATDLCGNTTSHTQTISVSDDEAPTGTASTPDVSCSEYNGNPDQMFGEIIANDNCGGEVQISFDVTEDEVLTMDTENQPSEDGCIQIRRTYTLVDLCGNTSQLIQTINLIDTTPPEYVGPMEVSIPAHEYDVDGNYPPDSPWDIIDGTGIVPIWYVDDCSGMDTCIIQDLPLSGGCANQPHPEFYGETATYLRTMTVWDNCGNMSMAEIIITLIDDIEPVFVGVPADYTVSCVGDVIYDDPVVTDLTDESVNVEETVEIVGQTCANSYQIVRTWVATDNCDNEATATQTITISDDIAPELTIPADYTAECSDEHPMDAAAATDNCGDVTVEETLVTLPGACAGDYIMERTFTATDACGNSTSATQVITIIDTTAPEFTSVPADYTAECSDEHPLDAASASDNCGDVTITVVADTTAGNCTGSYTVVRTFTATDDCGNASSATQTITIIDTTAPVLTIPADYTAECSDEHPLGDASAVDNCGDVTITLVTDTTSGSCPQAYYVARTFTAVDDCGNTSSATQTITIVDTTAPVIDAQDAMSISCDTYSADDAYGTAADNCGSTTLTWDDTAVSGGCTMPVGTYMRLYTAVDECGNVSTFEQVITLVDDTAPVFDFVPADYTAECDQTLLFEDVMASDNCSGVDVTEQRDTIAGDCPHAFTIVRTFTAIDNCDNVSSATQTIEVVDTTAPMLTIPADYTAECSADHPLNDASAYDNCGEVSLVMVVDTLAGDCSQSYTVTRTFTATDECGNSDTQVQTITIVDTTAPAFNESLPADATVECDAVPAADILTASDNCQAVSVQFEEAIQGGACPQTYTITRTWTVSDDCGNTSSHIQTLEVQDTTAPQLTIPADYTAECSEDHPLDAATAQDNCGIVTLEEVADTSFTCDHTYTVTRTFTATDECGNSTSASQIITIQDTTAPAFVEALPGDATVECDDVPAADVLTATDNCDAVEVSFEESIAEGDCPQQYTITRMWTVADACGNETSHTQTIEVVDTTAPNFTSTGELVNNEVVSVGYDDNFGSVTLPSLVDVTASDNCDEPVSCSDEATANANAELSAALGLEFNFDYLVNVDASGINNPFITGGAYTQGAIANPAVMADGETCDNNDVAHGVRMFNFMGGEYFITESGTATVDASGVHVVMTARNVADDDGILHVDAQFASLMTWQEWLDTPGNESFKSDCGLGNHEEWLYTVLTSGTITGEGSLAGTSLSLMHQPMNEYFGFQFGEGANNKNGNFGFSGWYYYSGTLSLNGNQSNVMGSGDLFGDLDFLQDWSTTLEYCVTDCAGNENTFSYTISSTGMIVNPLDEGGVQEGEDEFMVTAKDLISIQTLYPNPTSGQTSLVLESQEDVTATVSLFDMSGNLVMEIYQGMLYEDWSMNLTIDAQTLEAGMYQIQIHSKQFVTTKKLLVTE
ncbi:MAG: T9SS type A sorting domain-containing protein [Bacteroidetes bacterium]|nr:T9SS type A sorting domain-containing protein [Bacteroidota bacterium]